MSKPIEYIVQFKESCLQTDSAELLFIEKGQRLIRCADCAFMDIRSRDCHWCSAWNTNITDGDFFCGYAYKRKEPTNQHQLPHNGEKG